MAINCWERELAPQISDPSNWEWRPKYKEKWPYAPDYWQNLRQEWYGEENKPIAPILTMRPPLLKSETTTPIFIRDSYLEVFDIVYKRAMTYEGIDGVVITGQPGIGKTFFIYYCLVRLLQLKQPVLFSPDGGDVYLFYHDGVYTLPASCSFTLDGYPCLPRNLLPRPKVQYGVFIWSLFNFKERAKPPPVLVEWPCFPVQTASPNPVRFVSWSDYREALRTGLPLWSKEELVEGLKCQNDYPHLVEALEACYSGHALEGGDCGDPLACFPGARPLLTTGFAGADASPTVEEALDFLVDEAIDRFGNSARDVFDAVFNYTMTTSRHLSAFNLDLKKLKLAASDLAISHRFSEPRYDCILAVNPVYVEFFTFIDDVEWKVDFKSDWVTKKILSMLTEEQKRESSRTITYFQGMRPTRGLAGRFFEPVAHRHLAETAISGDFWPLCIMSSDGADAPHLTLAQDSFGSASVKLAKAAREVVKVTSINEVCLTHDSYYVPTDPAFPLFDSFIIELDFENRSGVLWVFQITTSRRRGGSRTGYDKVREIVAKLKERLRDKDVGEQPPRKKVRVDDSQISSESVEIRYVLVVPDYEGGFADWHFPPGWNQHREGHDHRGNFYCLKLSQRV